MIDDNKLDELLTDAMRSYRAPPDAPLDAIWSRVEAEAFAPKVEKRSPSWRVFGGAIAATLVFGVLLGRVTAGRPVEVTLTATQGRTPAKLTASKETDPYERTTQEFLGRTAVLLAALPTNGHAGVSDEKLNEQARQLLGTTRLLLDSPVAQQQSMKDLLQDLELVLAQVARLQSQHPGQALTLINEALEERDVVPRIRSAVAGLSISDY